jgi:hypothetical protein
LFLKDLFFLTFSLDKNNIGCPESADENRRGVVNERVIR